MEFRNKITRSRCLQGIWKVSGRCLGGVWRVTGMCLEGVGKASGRCQSVLYFLSVFCNLIYLTSLLQQGVLIYFDPKRDARVSFPPFSWGTILPLIGQTAHGRMAGIIVLTVWPIRDNFVPHENGRKLTLASLFCNLTYLTSLTLKSSSPEMF